MYIYKITNIVNGKVYIGQTRKTVEERWRGHCQDSKNKKLTQSLYNAIRKYGEQCFVIIQLCKCGNQEVLNEMEIFFIKKFGSLDRKIGYNLKEGGGIGTCLPEVARKISKTKTGVSLSEETRIKIGNALRGFKHSDEARKNMSIARIGYKMSEESRNKLSETNRNNPNKGWFKKGHGVSKEVRERISKANSGNTYNLGKKRNEEQRANMSKSLKGRIVWNKGLTTTDLRVKNNMRNIMKNQSYVR